MDKTKPPLHVYRSILRHLQQNCPSSSISPSSSLQSSLKCEIIKQYKQYQHLPPTSPMSIHQRKLAYDYYNLVADLNERQKLYDLDASAENQLGGKEMSRRAAARAGLQLPETYEPS